MLSEKELLISAQRDRSETELRKMRKRVKDLEEFVQSHFEEQDLVITYPVQLEHIAPSNAGWYKESLCNPEQFWGDLARDRLHWVKEFDTVMDCDMNSGSHKWFIGGKINVSGEKCMCIQ